MTEQTQTQTQTRIQRIKPLLVPAILFIGIEVLATSWLSANPGSNWRLAVALLPMVPGLWLAFGMLRVIGHLDELERKNMVDGMAFSFAGTLILTISLGFLNLAGVPQLDPSLIAVIMMVLWLIGKLWSGRMYR